MESLFVYPDGDIRKLMKPNLKIIASVDPGFTGAACFLLGSSPILFDPPLIQGKDRAEYDLKKMDEIFKMFMQQDVTMLVEEVSSMPNEGSVSSFRFGAGYMAWKMCGVANGFDVHDVRPTEWKKAYPELVSSNIVDELREEIKALRNQIKVMKDKELMAQAKKESDKLRRAIKTIAKDAARELAATMYPEVKSFLTRKKDDGRAEALLIAHYGKERFA
jgi:hypothetical protein|tara:strand:+ start:96 stop:752 length:657 start_codon:yes stop_codon:yes gene_type:complete